MCYNKQLNILQAKMHLNLLSVKCTTFYFELQCINGTILSISHKIYIWSCFFFLVMYTLLVDLHNLFTNILQCSFASLAVRQHDCPSSTELARKGWAKNHNPDSKVHGANMGPIWGQQDPDGPLFLYFWFILCTISLHAIIKNLHVSTASCVFITNG